MIPNPQSAAGKANPTLERLDLDNAHVIAFKWHIQETRPCNWLSIRYVSWPESLQGFA